MITATENLTPYQACRDHPQGPERDRILINQNWIKEALIYAGRETPDVLEGLIYNQLIFCDIIINFSDNVLIKHFKPVSSPNISNLTDYLFSFTELQNRRKELRNSTRALINLSYLHSLHSRYKKPLCDLFGVFRDYHKKNKVAVELYDSIKNYCLSLQNNTEKAYDYKTALQILKDIIDESLSENIATFASVCVFWFKITEPSQMEGLTSDILSLLSEHLKKVSDHAAGVEKQTFEKVLKSLEGRNLKHGKRADDMGFIGVVRSLETNGAKITKISRCRKVFDAEKIFKILKPYTRENPYQYENYDVFIEEMPDPQGFMDPSIFQITPDLKERHLTADSFRRRVLSTLIPH